MTGRTAIVVLRVALWLAAGAAAVALLYWGFLSTPDSRALMLALSAVLLVALLVVAALVVNTGLLLAQQQPLRTALGRGLRGVPACLVAAALLVTAVLIIRQFDDWLAAHAGEINAWFIATLNWSDVTILFEVERYLSIWLRWVLVPAAALALVASALRAGVRGVVSPAWIRAAWHWRTVLVATLAFVVLVWLPSLAASWRPAHLPPTWIEPALAGTRLLLLGGTMLAGVAVAFTAIARAVEKSGRETP